MRHAHNFQKVTHSHTTFVDDTQPASRVRRLMQTLRRAQADATYLNHRMLELPK
jgi:hypothetical protein